MLNEGGRQLVDGRRSAIEWQLEDANCVDPKVQKPQVQLGCHEVVDRIRLTIKGRYSQRLAGRTEVEHSLRVDSRIGDPEVPMGANGERLRTPAGPIGSGLAFQAGERFRVFDREHDLVLSRERDQASL